MFGYQSVAKNLDKGSLFVFWENLMCSKVVRRKIVQESGASS